MKYWAPTCVAGVALGTLLYGCQRSVDNETFFPLAKGHRWTYAQTVEHAELRLPDTLTVRSVGPSKFDDVPVAVRRDSHGNEYWLRQDDRGIARVASRTLLDAVPVRDADARWVLKAPFTVGTTWQARTAPYVLTRVVPFRERLHQHEGLSFIMQYEIAALDDTLQGPAGQLAPCLRVEGTGLAYVIADPRVAVNEVPVTQTEWYCKGVGLARLVRHEPLDTIQIQGGTLTLDLRDFAP